VLSSELSPSTASSETLTSDISTSNIRRFSNALLINGACLLPHPLHKWCLESAYVACAYVASEDQAIRYVTQH